MPHPKIPFILVKAKCSEHFLCKLSVLRITLFLVWISIPEMGFSVFLHFS